MCQHFFGASLFRQPISVFLFLRRRRRMLLGERGMNYKKGNWTLTQWIRWAAEAAAAVSPTCWLAPRPRTLPPPPPPHPLGLFHRRLRFQIRTLLRPDSLLHPPLPSPPPHPPAAVPGVLPSPACVTVRHALNKQTNNNNPTKPLPLNNPLINLTCNFRQTRQDLIDT